MLTIWNFHLNWADTICIERLNTFSLTVKIIYQGCICRNRSALHHVYRKRPYPNDHWSLRYISLDYKERESIFKMYLIQCHAHKITQISFCVYLQTFVANLLPKNSSMNNLQDFFHFLKDPQPITHMIKTSWNFRIILYKIYFLLIYFNCFLNHMINFQAFPWINNTVNSSGDSHENTSI